MRFVKIFNVYVNPNNVCCVEPRLDADEKVGGCCIYYNTAMNMSVFKTTINFAKNEDGSYKHTIKNVISALETGSDLNY